MAQAVLLLAIVTAIVSIVLAWREGRYWLDRREFYVSPITLFRRELSLAGICTIASVVIWAAYMPSAVRFAGVALFPVYLYIFLILRRRPE